MPQVSISHSQKTTTKPTSNVSQDWGPTHHLVSRVEQIFISLDEHQIVLAIRVKYIYVHIYIYLSSNTTSTVQSTQMLTFGRYSRTEIREKPTELSNPKLAQSYKLIKWEETEAEALPNQSLSVCWSSASAPPSPSHSMSLAFSLGFSLPWHQSLLRLSHLAKYHITQVQWAYAATALLQKDIRGKSPQVEPKQGK